MVETYRRRGLEVRRGAYVDDFIFDAVISEGPNPRVLEVLSFAPVRKDWTAVEQDAGHFIFALQQVGVTGSAVIQPPTEASAPQASKHYERVRRWLDKFDVPVARPKDILQKQPEPSRP